MRTKFQLTSEDTLKIMNACKEEAVKNNWAVSIAIVDEAGYLLKFERLDGASLPSSNIAIGKAKTSALAKAPTKSLEDVIKDRPAVLSFPDRTPVQGGLPIIYNGECVGGVGVSGVKSAEDEIVAAAGCNLAL
jgi:glc operon protein GlcG